MGHKRRKRRQIRQMNMKQTTSVRKRSNKGSDNQAVQIALLVIVLIWIAFMYDRLVTDPFLAIVLALGVLVILFGGAMRFGPIEIQKSCGHK